MNIAGLKQPISQRIDSFRSLNEAGKSVDDPVRRQAVPVKAGEAVAISGRTLLMTRVFDSKKLDYEPDVITEFNFKTQSGSCALFLTKEDRQVLADVYEYAQAQGADLAYVDGLAITMGYYRQSNNGAFTKPLSQVAYYDEQGHKLTYSFTDKDADTAKRILSSEALKTTRLDHTFIRHQLNADRSALGHTNFDFLEQVVNKFSAEGEKFPPLDGRFAQYKDMKNNVIEHASKERYLEFVSKKNTGSARGKNKSGVTSTQPAPPETLRQIFRRIMLQALGTSFGGRIVSLAEFLLRAGR